MKQILDQAFEGQKKELTEQASRTLKAQHKYVMEQYGPRMSGIYNTREYRLADLVKSIAIWDGPACQPAHIPESEKKGSWVIDESKLQKKAEDHAQKSVNQWKAKIISKLGNLDNISIAKLDGACGFYITGDRDGRSVEINQRMILNFRYSTGTIFNQFPSRIYVDGKSMSENKYKEVFKEVA